MLANSALMRLLALNSVAVLSIVHVLTSASEARADVSSWMYVGAGPAVVRHEVAGEKSVSDSQALLDFHAGIGSSPASPLVIGGLFKLPIYFDGGADLGLALRLTSRSFVQGDWGGALDLGGYQRFWGTHSTGFAGNIALGAPLGLTLNLSAGIGTNDMQTYSATLGIDFARLTVHRKSGSFWHNEVLPRR